MWRAFEVRMRRCLLVGRLHDVASISEKARR
jgi:hypothetical protein